MRIISIVVPVYCNAGSLPELHQRFAAVAAQAPHYEFEFIFTDDGSYDTSFTVLNDMAQHDPRVRVIKLARNFGSNIALMAGLHYTRGDCAIMISADLQDPPELIPEMLEVWQRGTKVVLAARRTRNDPFLSRIPAAFFNAAFRKFVFKEFPENGYDFALIDRQVISVVNQCEEKNSHLFGLVMWAGYKNQVLYYDREERRHGKSMWTLTKKLKYFIDAFTSFSYLPLRAASVLGFILAATGLVYALLVLATRIIGGIEVEGWSSLMIVLLLTAGVQLVMLGVIGEYIWRSLEQVRKRPLFIVESIVQQECIAEPVLHANIS